MTKKLSKEEKKKRKEERQANAQQMQKAPSTTVQNVHVPKAEGANQTPEPEVNLCDSCAYEVGECEGLPLFASDMDEGLKGAEADRVVKCPAWVGVEDFPTVDQLNKAAAPGPQTTDNEEEPPDLPDVTEDEIQDDVEAAEERSINKKEMAILEGLPARPDPKRFQNDDTDYGTCPACGRQLKRTAYNRYRDAIRCTNPRCGQYRAVVKTVSTGVK